MDFKLEDVIDAREFIEDEYKEYKDDPHAIYTLPYYELIIKIMKFVEKRLAEGETENLEAENFALKLQLANVSGNNAELEYFMKEFLKRTKETDERTLQLLGIEDF